MKRYLMGFVAAGILLLPGCGWMSSPSELLQPPALSGETSGIRQAVMQNLPDGTKLVVPKRTKHGISAITEADLNGDGVNEAFAFYKNESRDFDFGFLVMRQEKGKWVRAGLYAVPSRGCDYADLADLSGDGIPELLTGWNSGLRDRNELQVYSWKNQSLVQGDKLNYSELVIDDLDEDGKMELVLFQRDSDKLEASAQLYTSGPDGLKKRDQLALDGGINGYSQVVTGLAGDGRRGIFAEMGVGAHSSQTSLILLENGKLKDGLNDRPDQPIWFNPYSVLSQDINGDGIIEAVLQKESVVSGETPLAEMEWIYEWYQWRESGEPARVQETYMNYGAGYRLDLPESWHGRLQISQVNKDRKQVRFSLVALSGKSMELFTIGEYPVKEQARLLGEWREQGVDYVVLGASPSSFLAGIYPHGKSDGTDKERKELADAVPTKEKLQQMFRIIGM